MAGITLQQATAKLAEYLAAETAILKSGQHVMFEGKQLTQADLEWIQKGISYWDAKVKKLSRGGTQIKYGVPS